MEHHLDHLVRVSQQDGLRPLPILDVNQVICVFGALLGGARGHLLLREVELERLKLLIAV